MGASSRNRKGEKGQPEFLLNPIKNELVVYTGLFIIEEIMGFFGSPTGTHCYNNSCGYVGNTTELRQLVEQSSSADEFRGIAIYVVGSFGRKEIGPNSDLDIYSVSQGDSGVGSGNSFFPTVIANLKSHLGGDFVIDPKCLQNFSRNKLAQSIGTSRDDYENSFTARMLLLLESQALINENDYSLSIDTLASSYFLNRSFRSNHFPSVFLLDDLERYWKTLCVNYEISSYGGTRPLALKSLCLRFSRALTVFSTILNILVTKDFNETDLFSLARLTPLQRLAKAMDQINDASLLGKFEEALDLYHSFLLLKQRPDIAQVLEVNSELREDYLSRGDRFTDFLFGLLSGIHIDSKMRKHLFL